MQEYGREERIGSELQRELALLIRDEARDPRVTFVTIQEVRVVRDLSHAKVYFTLMDRDQAKSVAKVLNKAASFFRHQLSARMKKIRTIPQLHFVYDTSFETGMRLSSLIDEAVAKDSKVEED